MKVINYLLGYENLKIIQDTEAFRFSLDSVLLPNFITIPAKAKKILDIGTGNAPIPLILTTKTKASIIGVELQKESYEYALESVKINNLEDQIKIINGNIKEVSKTFDTDQFDIITCNPPYFKTKETNRMNNVQIKTLARHEVSLTIEEVILIARKLLKNNGVLGIVHRPERLLDILMEMRKQNIEPKRIQFVYPKQGKEANILLIEGRKNGKPGLKILDPLYAHSDDGNYTDQIKNILNRGDYMSQKSYQEGATLYLIPTPIGNMDDMTFRAIKLLNEVEVIFSEDTRVTSMLLKHFDIKKKCIASHQHNETRNKEKLLDFLSKGYSVGLVSDRGTPVISDPGYELAKCAIEHNYAVVGLPGATALIPALISSGIKPMPFLFYGFLDAKEGKCKKELEELRSVKHTLIFYEAPHRIEKTLKLMKEVFGNRQISISREISKKFEEIYRGTISTVLKEVKDAKGEFVIIVEGNNKENNFDHLSIIEHVNLYIKEGHSSKEAIKLVAKERNLNKNEVYQTYINTK